MKPTWLILAWCLTSGCVAQSDWGRPVYQPSNQYDQIEAGCRYAGGVAAFGSNNNLSAYLYTYNACMAGMERNVQPVAPQHQPAPSDSGRSSWPSESGPDSWAGRSGWPTD